MPRKSTARKTPSRQSGTRSRCSDAERAAWRERDDEVKRQSTEYLERAEAVRSFATHAATGGVSARILGYSLRNQLLLHEQAAERGFVLSDVETGNGWRQRGRHIKKGETGLRLIKPRGNGKKDADTAEPDTSNEPDENAEADDGDDASETPSRPKFVTVAVFDIAQTAEIPPEERDACPACPAQPGEPCHPGCPCPTCTSDTPPVDDPAETLWNKLLDQLTAHGYALDCPAPVAALHGHRVHVDHDARAVAAAFEVTAEHPTAVADLAEAVAQIIARSDHERAARREERRASRPAAPVTA
ncbi:ArdC family protein [Micromonospora sp. NPDC006766]|uniref:ArdC family protein n=1 Tax=Micromonospora sp. NPDC006766 TaxID=3154778 RepID=UPI0034020EB0